MVENVTYASFGRRLLAVILDSLIIVMFNFLVGFVFGIMFGGGDAGSIIASSMSSIVSMIVSFGYAIFFIGSRGQTPGKMSLGIKVVNLKDSQPPGYVGAFLREVVGKFVSAILLLLGYLWMLWDPQKQTWHDKIMRTYVLRDTPALSERRGTSSRGAVIVFWVLLVAIPLVLLVAFVAILVLVMVSLGGM